MKRSTCRRCGQAIIYDGYAWFTRREGIEECKGNRPHAPIPERYRDR